MSAWHPSAPLLSAMVKCALLAGVALLLLACSEPKPSVGGNTNWLRACEEDSDCGDSLGCVCGRCSLECSAADRCAEWPGSTCATGVALELQCGADSSAPGICLLRCNTDADCDGDLACVQGSCVARAQDSSCGAHRDALLCSGFDSDELSEWTITGEPDSTLAATPSPRHAGRSALEARANGRNSRSRFIADYPPRTSGTLYLRVWMFVPQGTVLRNLHTVTIGNGDTPDWGVNLLFFEEALAVETPTEAPAGRGVAPPRDRWFCVQAEVSLSDSEGTVRAYLDQQLAVSVTGIDTLPEPGAHNLTVGIDHSAQPESASVFFDELLLDDQPTRCGR